MGKRREVARSRKDRRIDGPQSKVEPMQFVADIPAGRLGEGAEAAELALALSTSASDFLAGQVIPISGGWVT